MHRLSCPAYATIGSAAIVLLSILRFLQGIALGGSWDGLPSLLALSAPPNRRGWYAMIPQLGAPIGFMIAAALFLFLHASLWTGDFLDWGWRYPFYVAFAINVVALFARLRLVVTNEYEALLDKNELEPVPLKELFQARGANLFIGAFASLASYALFHLVTVFPLSWITLNATQPVRDVLWVQIIGAGICIVGVIVSGWIADPLRPAQHPGRAGRDDRGVQRLRADLADGRDRRREHLHPARLSRCWACRTARLPAR